MWYSATLASLRRPRASWFRRVCGWNFRCLMALDIIVCRRFVRVAARQHLCRSLSVHELGIAPVAGLAIVAGIAEEFLDGLADEVRTDPKFRGSVGAPGARGRDAELDYAKLAREIAPEIERLVAARAYPGPKGDAGLDGADARVDYERLVEVIWPRIEGAINAGLSDPIPGPPGARGEPGHEGPRGLSRSGWICRSARSRWSSGCSWRSWR